MDDLFFPDRVIRPQNWRDGKIVIKASWAAFRSALVYRRKGLDAAVGTFANPGPIAATRKAGVAEDPYSLNVLASRLHGFTRLCLGEQTCLFHSVAICSGLRAVGVRATVVFGSESVAMRRAESSVHAWVAVGDLPIGAMSEVTEYYIEVARLPNPLS